ncbi:DoxX family protein [bacterium]|nr:DoxX family protein [bacterium]MBP9811169.1 DoxX family protein [bacterium]
MKARTVSIYLLALFFSFAGVMHFVKPDIFMRAMPPYLPYPLELVLISGVFEILGGVGLLAPYPKLRRAAGFGLIALLIAVFPANINMALNPQLFKEIAPIVLYCRLPLQLVLILWVRWVSK